MGAAGAAGTAGAGSAGAGFCAPAQATSRDSAAAEIGAGRGLSPGASSL